MRRRTLARDAVLRFAAIVYPVMWVAVDTLMAAVLPDGNWASLAYTQSDVHPIMQTASLFGVAGVLFLVTLGPSSKGTAAMLGVTAGLVTAAVGFGVWRLGTAPPEVTSVTRFGLVAIDDAIGLAAKPPYVNAIWAEYEKHVAALAAEGAQVVLLPEKIAVVTQSGLTRSG